MLKQTLEQRRALDTWEKSKDCGKDYVKIAKGLPALIMNSGLMQTMAFLHDKGSGSASSPHRKIEEHLLEWMSKRYGSSTDFAEFMKDLMNAKPDRFQAITAEAFAWLRWMRQMAAARNGGD